MEKFPCNLVVLFNLSTVRAYIAKRKAFNAYVKALLSRTSTLTPKQEEYFVKKSLELKIFDSKDMALRALNAFKEKIIATKATSRREIGFTKEPNPNVQSPGNGSATKHIIGFNDKANPSIPSPGSNIIRNSPKIGFNLTASTAAVAKRLLAFTAGGAVAGILLSPEESIAADDYENYLLDNHPKGTWAGSLTSNSNPNRGASPALVPPTRSSDQDGVR